jgi:two-component system sensor histidine kinase CpxA
VRLREVARQVAAGDLSARVGPPLSRRGDELTDLGRDFDLMASRIEALIGAQRRLIRDISHELRSPLARLGVALDLARKRAGPKAAGHLARIEREADRLSEMINQLLSLSYAETVGEGPGNDAVDLGLLVREVADDADYEARSRGGSVELTSCGECVTVGRRALLRSAVENIVRNAVRHGPHGAAVRVTLRRESEGLRSYAVIEVLDQGPGVPESSLSEIFRPFYRVDDSRSRQTGGAGLGLAITDRAVQLHGGTVVASNLPAGGFLVAIRLPLVKPCVG